MAIRNSRLLLLWNPIRRTTRDYSPAYRAAFYIASALWLLCVPVPVQAQETVRPEIGKPLQAAQEPPLPNRYQDAKLVIGAEKSADIDRRNRLRDLIVKQFAESRKAQAASKDRAAINAALDDNAPINMGVSPGQMQGVSTMGSRINKGPLC